MHLKWARLKTSPDKAEDDYTDELKVLHVNALLCVCARTCMCIDALATPSVRSKGESEKKAMANPSDPLSCLASPALTSLLTLLESFCAI